MRLSKTKLLIGLLGCCIIIVCAKVLLSTVQMSSEKSNDSRFFIEFSKDEFVAFFISSMKFDFCGNIDTEKSELLNSIELSDNLLEGRWVEARYAGALFLELPSLQDLCGKYEMSVVNKNFNNARYFSHCIRKKLLSFMNMWDTAVDARSTFLRAIVKVEYSIARLINRYQPISESDILEMLPDELFYSILQKNPKRNSFIDEFLRCLIFRNMLIIGSEVVAYKEKTGEIPNELAELPKVLKYQQVLPLIKIEYSIRNGVWQLFSATHRGGRNLIPFNLYPPVITTIEGYSNKFTKGIWFSSDFSKKRNALYLYGSSDQLYKIDEWGCVRDI